VVQIRWLWEYWPRKMEVREGQHSAVVTYARSNEVPSATSNERTFGISATDATS